MHPSYALWPRDTSLRRGGAECSFSCNGRSTIDKRDAEGGSGTSLILDQNAYPRVLMIARVVSGSSPHFSPLSRSRSRLQSIAAAGMVALGAMMMPGSAMAQWQHTVTELPGATVPGGSFARDPSTGRVVSVDVTGATWTFVYSSAGNSWQQTSAPLSILGANTRLATVGGIPGTRLLGYDAVNRVTVEFLGGVWTTIPTSTPPPLRFASSLVGLDNGDLLLFGGYDGTATVALNETWRFSGNTWQLVPTLNAPTPRAGASMAATPAGARLYGGISASSVISNELWEFTNNNWSLLDASSPAPRFEHVLVHRPEINQTLVIGGMGLDSLCMCIKPAENAWVFANNSWAQAGAPWDYYASPVTSGALDSVQNEIVAGGQSTYVSSYSGAQQLLPGCICLGQTQFFRTQASGVFTLGGSFDVTPTFFNPANFLVLGVDVALPPPPPGTGWPLCSYVLPATASLFLLNPAAPPFGLTIPVPTSPTVIGAQLVFQSFQPNLFGLVGCNSDVAQVRIGR